MATPKLVVPEILRDTNDAAPLNLLERYFGLAEQSVVHTGAAFETIGLPWDASEHASEITTADLVALATLSVEVKGAAAVSLFKPAFSEETSALLKSIPIKTRIIDKEAETLLAPEGAASRLWTHLRTVKSFGPTRTSKLMARKRCDLIPIYDSVVAEVLGLTSSRHHWTIMSELMTANGNEQYERAAQLAKTAGLPQGVTPLRVIDIILWRWGKDRGF